MTIANLTSSDTNKRGARISGKVAAVRKTILFLLLVLPLRPGRGDEGMWLLNQPPRELLKTKYTFNLDDAWLERTMKASVRFNNGGSGGFVSPAGLVVTNHHIAADSLQKLSTSGRDLHKNGFFARTLDEEWKCPDLELNVLQAIEDVTEKVQSAVTPAMTPAEARQARAAVWAKIEKDSLAKTGLRSDVVNLYQGGKYHLYRYKKFTDVRLVMAPEHDIAAFGGDTDNFEYPRFCLDVSFFRVYENDKPAKTPHYFKWSAIGPKDGDLVFVSGHPGTTNRLETLAKLTHRRDVTLPYLLTWLRYKEALLLQFSERGPEQARMAAQDLYPVANARKALTGQYHGLLDPAILAKKEAAEKILRDPFEADAGKAKISPWKKIAEVQDKLTPIARSYYLLERGDAFDSRLFKIARHLVRLAGQPKDDARRLPEYRAAAMESLKFQLFSPAPIHAELERVKLTASLAFLAENLGAGHPVVTKVFAGKAPAARSAELVAGTRLRDPAERKRLFQGGMDAIKKSDDAMIGLAHLIDAEARQVRRPWSDLGEIESQAGAGIARLRFAKFGTTVPPDATFTLRLAFGVVKGYQVDGQELPFHTNLAGAFERAKLQSYKPPFDLPKRWLDNKGKVDPGTPFNFVSTADTVGGNSGSPVLNRAGELVGINFDRNRHGLVRNFVYTDEQARHISVHSRAVLEALRGIYQAGPFVRELGSPE